MAWRVADRARAFHRLEPRRSILSGALPADAHGTGARRTIVLGILARLYIQIRSRSSASHMSRRSSRRLRSHRTRCTRILRVPLSTEGAYVSMTMYGASVGVYDPGNPDSASQADAEFTPDSTGGSTIVVWPRDLPLRERKRLFDYARAQAWALIRGGLLALCGLASPANARRPSTCICDIQWLVLVSDHWYSSLIGPGRKATPRVAGATSSQSWVDRAERMNAGRGAP